ncbi:LexA family transcriptional regulator [Marinobacter oulmenensis]|uniref:Phage repressor protein C with HTH and peptisase S24 domain n=1 Tax=Marinobacter oulmenensis TaxID=643747 RepID=A0A840U419_9GAMM|nr:S24 family peptidase [Marinobacter oulmenensis]MBB5320454.1 phage repressor protein C with HTH and peptisase S24 domain [Marinobacter oulmenensis]
MSDEKYNGLSIVTRMKECLGLDRDKDLAAHFGVNPQMVYNWKARGTIPLDQCIQLREEKGLSLDWLLLGVGISEPVREPSAGYYVDQEYTEVPLYDVEASAGDGSFFEDENIVGYRKFSNDWLTREGLNKATLALIRVAGDSMDSTLHDGDTVLVDLSKRKPDGVFALRFGDALRIKRLQRMTDGSLRVSSDNEMYREEVVHPENLDQIEIIGLCHWRGGRVF